MNGVVVVDDRLVKISEANADVCLTLGSADTAQWGNYSGFRNAKLDDVPMHIGDQWMAQKVQTGTLKFDFVSTTRPPLTSIVSNRAFESILLKAAHVIGAGWFEVRPMYRSCRSGHCDFVPTGVYLGMACVTDGERAHSPPSGVTLGATSRSWHRQDDLSAQAKPLGPHGVALS